MFQLLLETHQVCRIFHHGLDLFHLGNSTLLTLLFPGQGDDKNNTGEMKKCLARSTFIST